jgi:hypothetical protein
LACAKQIRDAISASLIAPQSRFPLLLVARR